MKRVNKRIVTDENNRPMAVQIPYEEWLGIEEMLNVEKPGEGGDPSRLAGSLQWGEDGLACQRRVREEWTRWSASHNPSCILKSMKIHGHLVPP